ncbi:MAG: hypothetical protein ACJ735_12875 [Actinomycetes bacterium]
MTTRRLALAAVVIAVVPLAAQASATATAATADTLILPTPITKLPTFNGLGLRPDRRLVSSVPGTVTTREDVAVAVNGSGTPTDVQLDEHLHVTGTGAYLIYERGPARAAAPLSNSLPPVLELGTVVWQGFSPGGRDLAARLRLDPALEAQRLPLRVALSWQPNRGGAARPLDPNGAVPPGTVHLRLVNTTGTPRSLPTGIASPTPLGKAMTTLLAAARRNEAQPTTAFTLPVAGRGLPRRLPATDVGNTAAFVAAPLRVVGSLRAPNTQATLTGPTVAPVPDGGRFNGVLTGAVDFTLTVPKAGRVVLDLTATPTLDARTLQPPHGQRTWADWARLDATTADARGATSQLVNAAAAAARGAELSPYVGSDTNGPATTRFRYVINTAARPARTQQPLHPHPLAIGVAAFAALLTVSGAAAVWRRS